MSNNLSVTSYHPVTGDVYLFDANIWLYLFCPIGDYQPHVVRKYSKFFSEILKAKSQIIVPAQVLSEFFNVYVKIEFSRKRDAEPMKYRHFKKDFRNSAGYKEVVKSISNIITDKILKVATPVSDDFSNLNTSNILTPDCQYDFNDNFFLELCRHYSYKIVSNDKDMLNSDGVDVISAWVK